MLYRVAHRWLVGSVAALFVVQATPGTIAVAQEAAAQASPATEEAAAPPAEQIDPYEVPEGNVDRLFEYLRVGPNLMRPRTRDDAVRMFHSLDTAANRIYEADDATLEQREEAAGARVEILSQLQMFGKTEAGGRLSKFLDRMRSSNEPRLQDFAKQTLLDQKIRTWRRLDAAAQDEVLAEVRQEVTAADVSPPDVVAMMKLADAASETPAAEKVVTLIQDVLPGLRKIEQPGIVSRVDRLEGIVRRLQLPGNKMEVDGTLLNGEMVDWESYRGKVVLVDYWATWCGPCMAELPNVVAAYKAYHEKGFDVLGISLDSDREAVEQFVDMRKLPWKTLFNESSEATGWDHPMARRYAINKIPRAILVDQQGNVVSMHVQGGELKNLLRKLLGPAEPAAADEARSQTPNSASQTASIENRP